MFCATPLKTIAIMVYSLTVDDSGEQSSNPATDRPTDRPNNQSIHPSDFHSLTYYRREEDCAQTVKSVAISAVILDFYSPPAEPLAGAHRTAYGLHKPGRKPLH